MERVPELDALRGLGAATILCYHYWPNTFFFGWSRVDFFFVLSGYLTTRALVGTSSKNKLSNYYSRRAGRLCPAYYLLLLLFVASDMQRADAEHMASLIRAATFTQYTTYYWSDTIPLYTIGKFHLHHTWSLAVELQFYLIWPWMLLLCRRELQMTMMAWVAVNSVAARAVGLHPWTLLARCDGLALGGILAMALLGRRRLEHWATRVILAALSLTGLCYIVTYRIKASIPSSFNRPLDLGGSLAVLAANLFYTGLIGLVICLSGRAALMPLRFPVLCYLGRVSYGVYLYNYSVLYAVVLMLGDESPWTKPAAVVLTIAAAALSWELFEQPLSKVGPWCRTGSRSGATSPLA